MKDFIKIEAEAMAKRGLSYIEDESMGSGQGDGELFARAYEGGGLRSAMTWSGKYYLRTNDGTVPVQWLELDKDLAELIAA